MSEMYQRLAHSSWDCKYHVVFVPMRRRKVLFGQARRKLGEVFHALARQKECQIIEGHLLPDHVHMCIAIPPKYPVSSVIGFLKGRHSDGPLVWQRAEFHGRALLGSWIRSVHSGL
jgi:putative transposase